MQFLALAKPRPDLFAKGPPTGFEQVLQEEQARSREAYAEGWLRQIWLRQSGRGAVAIVEALSRDQAGHELPGIEAAVAVHAIVDQDGPAGQDGAVDALLDLIQELKQRGREPEKLPSNYWTEAVHQILLRPAFSDCLADERIPCGI